MTINRMNDGYLSDMHITARAGPLADSHARAFSALTRDLLGLSLSRGQLDACLNKARQAKALSSCITLMGSVGRGLQPAATGQRVQKRARDLADRLKEEGCIRAVPWRVACAGSGAGDCPGAAGGGEPGLLIPATRLPY
ncbi:hypothetical protein [Deinococcus arcticus]|uniref:hypothetical protein n=1 Tax=Deinococcus arcticus TaxID=2136176 RepID=UPI001304C09D|nr:hypothetical protein [Deinococcus arcticus]